MSLIYACFYAVDAFFWLSGFFLAYVCADVNKIKYLRFSKPGSSLMAILHRLMRIWPCFAFMVIFWWQVAVHLGQGPIWNSAFHNNCDEDWWKNITFTDVYMERPATCLGWGWYLSNDMAMFLVSLICLNIYSHSRRCGYFSIFCTICIGLFLDLSIADESNMKVSIGKNMDEDEDFYFRPQFRSTPYFIGLLLGILYRNFSND